MPDTAVFDLPERLDSRSIDDLTNMLLDRRGAGLVLDASRVSFVGAMVLQLLMMAQRQWSADGLKFDFCATSEAFDQGLLDLGTTRESLMKGDFQ